MKDINELLRNLFYESYLINSISLHKEENQSVIDGKYTKGAIHELWFYSQQIKERRIIKISKEQYDELSEILSKTYCEGE